MEHDWLLDLGYWGLFIGSFLAATIVPFSADILLIGMLIAGGSPWAVISIATAGNFIGGLTSYGVGRIGKWEWIERFGVKAETLEKQKAKIDKYGSWAALMSWVPIIGDVIAVALGFYRTRFLPSALFMFIGKAGRFVAWYYIWLLTASNL
jgi:membrane protein YqaA with SNARE-associated domain